MKTEKFDAIFHDPELRKVLRGSVPAHKELKKKAAVQHLLQAQNQRLEALFLRSVQESRQYPKFCKRLLACYPAMKAATHASFPQEECLLRDLKKRAQELQTDDHALATKISKEIKERVKKDPSVVKGSETSLTHSDDIKASLVKLPHQHFVLSACPKTPLAARLYFEACMRSNTSVFVALLESHEASSRSNNFWKDKALHARPEFKDLILSTTSKVWLKQLVETEIVFTNGKKVTFFHHENWKDHHPAPDRTKLSHLVSRVLSINAGSDAPIAVNCRGGIGRTAVLAVYAYLRQEVDAKLAKGIKLDEITINIPEVLYQFRRQRPILLGNAPQVTQLYKLMHDYYLELQSRK